MKSLTSKSRLLPRNACWIFKYVRKLTKQGAYHLSHEINDTYNDLQTDENNDSIIIARRL